MSDQQSDLVRLLRVLRQRWLIVLAVPVLLAGPTYAYFAAQPKEYEATAILLAGQGKGIADLSSIIEVGEATQSLGGMITDRVVIELAAKRRGITTPIRTLERRITSEVPPNSQEIQLTVRDTNPRRARDLANEIADVFSHLVARRAAPNSNLSASVWQRAHTPEVAAGPAVTLNTAIAAIVGLLLGLGLALLRDHLDMTWRDEADVERTLGIPVLSSIPTFRHELRRGRVHTSLRQVQVQVREGASS